MKKFRRVTNWQEVMAGNIWLRKWNKPISTNTQRVFNGYCPCVLANIAVQSSESSNLESPMLLCRPTRTIHSCVLWWCCTLWPSSCEFATEMNLAGSAHLTLPPGWFIKSEQSRHIVSVGNKSYLHFTFLISQPTLLPLHTLHPQNHYLIAFYFLFF